MLQITTQTRIFIGIEPLDFRTGFNGTAAECRLKIQQNPLNGGLFVFINRSKTMIRLYFFDGHGEWLITKRVAQGRFIWWKDIDTPENIMVEQLHIMLRGGNPQIRLPPLWKNIE